MYLFCAAAGAPSSSSSTPDSPTLFTWTRRRTFTKRITPTSSLFSTVLSLATAYGVERSLSRRQGTVCPPSAIRPTSAASSNQTILLMMDSMSYTTYWSTDGITRTFACHLHPVMPIFCNGQRTKEISQMIDSELSSITSSVNLPKSS